MELLGHMAVFILIFVEFGFNFPNGYSAICSFLNSMQKCLLFPNTYEKYFPLVIEILTNIIISHRVFICIFSQNTYEANTVEKYDFLNFIVTVSKMSKILREISFILAEECTINLNMYSAMKRMRSF